MTGWAGAALLLDAVALAACSQTPSTTTAGADTAPAPVIAEAQPAATEVQPSEAQSIETQPAAAEEQPAAAVSDMIVKLNLNTTSSDEFQTIPDVGSRMVREFNEYRPYASILQFRKEIGKS